MLYLDLAKRKPVVDAMKVNLYNHSVIVRLNGS